MIKLNSLNYFRQSRCSFLGNESIQNGILRNFLFQINGQMLCINLLNFSPFQMIDIGSSLGLFFLLNERLDNMKFKCIVKHFVDDLIDVLIGQAQSLKIYFIIVGYLSLCYFLISFW